MTNLIKLNKEELGLGAAFGLAFAPVIGFKAVFLALVCALLWAIGGSGWGRAWRFIGVPAAAFVFLALMRIDPMAAAKGLGVCVAVLTLGYGIPDATDSGSFLGRILYKVARKNAFAANLATRAVYACLLSIGPIFLAGYGWPFFIILLAGQLAAVLLLEGEILI